MARYAIKHTESGKILQYDFCCDVSELLDEKEELLSWATKQDAENHLKNIQNYVGDSTIKIWNDEDDVQTEHSLSEFEVSEL